MAIMVEDINPPGEENKGRLVFTEAVYGVFFRPAKTLAALGREKPLAWAVGIKIGVGLFSFLMTLALLDSTVGYFFPNIPLETVSRINELIREMFLISGPVGILFSLIWWLLLSGFYNLLAELFGGHGNAVGLFTALGFTALPQLLLPPVEFLAAVFGGPELLSILVSLVIFLWVAWLYVLALREINGLSTGRALAVFFFPVLVLGLLLVLVFLFSIVLLRSLVEIIPGGILP